MYLDKKINKYENIKNGLYMSMLHSGTTRERKVSRVQSRSQRCYSLRGALIF